MGNHLQACAQIERTLAQAYRLLAERFRLRHAEVGELFSQMATDEEAHASKIVFACRLDALEGDILTAENQIGSAFIERLQALSLALLNDCGREGLTVREAIEIARKLESEFQEIHLEKASEIQDGNLSKLFKALARGDEAHQKALHLLLLQLTA